MAEDIFVKVPRYQKIALDIANRIAKGEFKEGSKIFGRSSLAGEYNVSPETIRRAIILLEDMQVVEASVGSGIVIISQRNAHIYVDRFKSKETISTLKDEIQTLLKQKEEIDKEITDRIDKIIDYAGRLKHTNPLNPIEIPVEKGSHLIGKTINESKFWQNTGATIIGIRRNKQIILSPGPYLAFEDGDQILAIGNPEIITRALEFMK
jgi:K+/H+ antiporter YhaU regulatory subunit KhtT